MINAIEPWVVGVDFVLLLALLVVVLKELHDIYLQTARLVAVVDKLHLMIWGALGTPEVSTPDQKGDSAAGRIYAPEGFFDQAEESVDDEEQST